MARRKVKETKPLFENQIKDSELLTAEEISKILRVNPKTIRNWASLGKIPCVKLSARNIRYLKSEVFRWIQEHSA